MNKVGLLVDLVEDEVVLFGLLVDGANTYGCADGVDEFGSEIEFEGGLEEEGDVVEEETEGEGPQFVFDCRYIVEIVGP